MPQVVPDCHKQVQQAQQQRLNQFVRAKNTNLLQIWPYSWILFYKRASIHTIIEVETKDYFCADATRKFLTVMKLTIFRKTSDSSKSARTSDIQSSRK